jgi:hypothetical protein
MVMVMGVVRRRLGAGRRRRRGRKSKGVTMLQAAAMGALATAGILKDRHHLTLPRLGCWLSLARILPIRRERRRRRKRKRRNEGVAGSELSRPRSRGGKYILCERQSFDARDSRDPDCLDHKVHYKRSITLSFFLFLFLFLFWPTTGRLYLGGGNANVVFWW